MVTSYLSIKVCSEKKLKERIQKLKVWRERV